MVIGTTLFKSDGNSYYSPEFPRGGLAMTASFDLTHINGSPTFTVTVEHRNSEDTTWTTAGAFAGVTATGAASTDITGIKEIVRFKFDFDAADDATDSVHFIVQALSWRPYP